MRVRRFCQRGNWTEVFMGKRKEECRKEVLVRLGFSWRWDENSSLRSWGGDVALAFRSDGGNHICMISQAVANAESAAYFTQQVPSTFSHARNVYTSAISRLQLKPASFFCYQSFSLTSCIRLSEYCDVMAHQATNSKCGD